MLRLTVHFRNTTIQVTRNTYQCDCEYVLTKHYCGHKIVQGTVFRKPWISQPTPFRTGETERWSLRRSSSSKQVASGDLVKCSPVCPQFLTRSAFSARWHLDQRSGRGTFIRPSPSGVRRPPSSISAEVGQCEHRGAGKADQPAVVHVISLFNTQELYFRNCPILRTCYEFQLLVRGMGLLRKSFLPEWFQGQV